MLRLDAPRDVAPGAESGGSGGTSSGSAAGGLEGSADVIMEVVVEGFTAVPLGTPRDGTTAEAGAPPTAFAAGRVLAAVRLCSNHVAFGREAGQ